MVAGFVLSVPWGLYDLDRAPSGLGRVELAGVDRRVKVRAGPPVILVTNADHDPKVDARRRGIEPEGPSFRFGDTTVRHRIVDVGTRPNEMGAGFRLADGEHWHLHYEGHIPRPGFAARHKGSFGPTSLRAEELDTFIFGCIERIRSGAEGNLGRPGWDLLDEAWSDARLDARDPPMELVVRHAEHHARLLADLVKSPRRVLKRDRDLVTVDKVQQIDVACIRWLIRQPGRDIYEQAGPRQRILAVVREQEPNTLENRVVRDFAARSAILAASYCKRHDRYRGTDRWTLVDRYRMECRRAEEALAEAGIDTPEHPIVPNFALLRDARYGRIWIAYQEILRHDDERDECWRWQHRLWADFCRLAAQLAVRRMPGSEVVAETPLRIFDEQRRGRWTSLAGQSGVLLVRRKHGKPPLVVSVVADLSEPHDRVPGWMTALCPSAILIVDDLANGEAVVVPVWAMHSCSEERLDLSLLAASARRAIDRAVDVYETLSGNRQRQDRPPGIVLVSSVSVANDARFAKNDTVVALTLNPDGKHLSAGLTNLGRAIEVVLGAVGGGLR
jgi:hypothetical protein